MSGSQKDRTLTLPQVIHRATGMGARFENSSSALLLGRNDREAERVVNGGKTARSALGSQRVKAAVGTFPSGTWLGAVNTSRTYSRSISPDSVTASNESAMRKISPNKSLQRVRTPPEQGVFLPLPARGVQPPHAKKQNPSIRG